MTVLVVHPHLHVFGGSEKLTKILIYELASMNNEVVVLTTSKSPEFHEHPGVFFEPIKEYQVTPTSSSVFIEKLINAMYSIDEAIKRYSPDVCLTMIQEPVYTALAKLVKPTIGSAIYIHYPFEEELTAYNMLTFLSMYRFPYIYEDLYRLADLHMSNSNYTAQALYNSFKVESNVVYPAVEWDYFIDEPNLEEERENVIVSVGRFVPQKRQDVLIEWYARYVKPAVPDSRLLIIGIPDGRFATYYEKLKNAAQQVEGVSMVDRPLSAEEMLKYYRESKVYVHLRVGEHFGMAPVEAMSQGAIPILPEKSGLAELITPGRDGFVAGKDSNFINYVIKVLKAPREELAQMRKFAYRRAWYFNPDRFAKEVAGYLKIIAKSQQSTF